MTYTIYSGEESGRPHDTVGVSGLKLPYAIATCTLQFIDSVRSTDLMQFAKTNGLDMFSIGGNAQDEVFMTLPFPVYALENEDTMTDYFVQVYGPVVLPPGVPRLLFGVSFAITERLTLDFLQEECDTTFTFLAQRLNPQDTDDDGPGSPT